MTRNIYVLCFLFGGIMLCSCSEPNKGIKTPTTVTPPPERLEIHVAAPGITEDASEKVE